MKPQETGIPSKELETSDSVRNTPQPLENVDQAFRYLESFTNLEKMKLTRQQRDYRLDRMERLLEMYGDPQTSFKAFHIAGTKGKGSTAAFLASVLHASGHRTALYTSPHVSSYLERISVDMRPPPEDLIVSLVGDMRDDMERIASELPGGFPPTTFELLTLLAFLVFERMGCEYGVIETGIGGRLDATNVLNPEACLLTPLDLEHTELLGNTLEEIAEEKGGIIKPHTPVFCGFQEQEAKAVFRRICGERESTIRFLDEELEKLEMNLERSGTWLCLKLKGRKEGCYRLSMVGRFQAENAALAYLCLSHLCLSHNLPFISSRAFERGLLDASLPGRMEIIGSRPPVILDGAHTPLAIERLLESYGALFEREGVLIFGSVSGKDPKTMAALLCPYFDQIIISKPGSFKESDPGQVHGIFQSLKPDSLLIEDPMQALQTAIELTDRRRPLVVTGSFYMVCEVRRFLTELTHRSQLD
jgi:dihydrofolate synthase/folylpolyglutamate synthase